DVRAMFGGIARRYDLMNTIMTAGRHHRWRRLAVEAAGARLQGTALDVCCGTGDLAFSLYDAVGPMGSVTAIDFSRRMLSVGRQKAREKGLPINFKWGDATSLDFEDDSFDAATVGFGVRNIADIDAVFSEMTRVVRPGGRVVCLEITRPAGQPFKLFYGVWFDRVVSVLGRMVAGQGSAYSYLPESVKHFPEAPALAGILRSAGLKDVSYRLLAGGIIALHWGTA
ncbi:MAG: bifunctional demethylmenaquinone methyltransferase/2-methoxy-6-polyprenyl-1,4-benzoquinol methylase UbiE, partial [Actinomycetota bacterium]